MDQTERRIFDEKCSPFTNWCRFLNHTDILCKRNSVVYGHKVCLSFGKRVLCSAAEVLRGESCGLDADDWRIEQVQSNSGKTPHDVAMDGGFA